MWKPKPHWTKYERRGPSLFREVNVIPQDKKDEKLLAECHASMACGK